MRQNDRSHTMSRMIESGWKSKFARVQKVVEIRLTGETVPGAGEPFNTGSASKARLGSASMVTFTARLKGSDNGHEALTGR